MSVTASQNREVLNRHWYQLSMSLPIRSFTQVECTGVVKEFPELDYDLEEVKEEIRRLFRAMVESVRNGQFGTIFWTSFAPRTVGVVQDMFVMF